jgi:transcriptional regulator with GAF, ATPase, and Fis domain
MCWGQFKRREEQTKHSALQQIMPDAEMKELEANNIRVALAMSDGKIYGKQGAAARLAMKPTTLASRIKALGILS